MMCVGEIEMIRINISEFVSDDAVKVREVSLGDAGAVGQQIAIRNFCA